MKKISKLLVNENSESSMSDHDNNQLQYKIKFKNASTLPNQVQEEDSIDQEVMGLINQEEIKFLSKQNQQIPNNTVKNITKKQSLNNEMHLNKQKSNDQQNAPLSQETQTASLQLYGGGLVPKNILNKTIQQNEEKVDKNQQKVADINFSKYQFKQSITETKNILKNNKQGMGQKMIVVDSDLIQNQKEIQINNIPVYFPYDAYNLQIDYMRAIVKALSLEQNAILQSPTGTGKTLCLLCSVLSWVQNYSRSPEFQMRQKRRGEKVRVIYLSRTHTQLKQVQKQLQKTCFRPTIANFGSRDQFCIKSEYSEFKGRDLMQACSKGVKLALKAKRKLQIEEQANIDEVQKSNLSEEGHACRYYKSQGEYLDIVQKRYMNKIIDSDQIKREGQYHGFCPYYYPFQIQEKADVIFMPYNYILDVGLLSRYKQIIHNSILIFDEAHNVPEAACQGRSLTITSRIFDHIKVQLAKLEQHPRMSAQLRQISYEYEKIRALIEKFANLYLKNIQQDIEHIFNQSIHKNQYESDDVEKIFKSSEMRKLFYKWFYPGKLKEDLELMTVKAKKQIHLATIKNLTYLTEQTGLLIEALKETFDGIFQNMEKFMGFLFKVAQLIDTFQENMPQQWWKEEINHYRFSIKTNIKDKQFFQLKLVCLTSSLTFDQILKIHPRSIILTSGTLSPLSSWEKQLNIKFEVQLLNPHIIQEDQLHLATICKNENRMNFSYKQTQARRDIYKELVYTVSSLLDLIPNGVLIIFPSYRHINSFKNELRYNRASLQRLKQTKQILFEEKGTDQYLLQRFKQRASTQKGVALICVCRGKISEGLDFSDQLCRAVIFIGVPYPNVNDPILKEKRNYWDKLSKQCTNKTVKSLTGDQWYNLNTMRAVNQGIGRVIRHINDYGMIFLLDDRYQQYKLKNMLPKWSKTNSKAYDDFHEVEQYVDHFFKAMKQKFPQQDKKMKQMQKRPSKPDQKKNAFQIMMGNAAKKTKKVEIKRPSIDKVWKKNKIQDFL